MAIGFKLTTLFSKQGGYLSYTLCTYTCSVQTSAVPMYKCLLVLLKVTANFTQVMTTRASKSGSCSTTSTMSTRWWPLTVPSVQHSTLTFLTALSAPSSYMQSLIVTYDATVKTAANNVNVEMWCLSPYWEWKHRCLVFHWFCSVLRSHWQSFKSGMPVSPARLGHISESINLPKYCVQVRIEQWSTRLN